MARDVQQTGDSQGEPVHGESGGSWGHGRAELTVAERRRARPPETGEGLGTDPAAGSDALPTPSLARGLSRGVHLRRDI